MDMAGNKIYAVDFDGTLSQGVPFPEIGEANEPLFDMLIREKEKGSRIILFTCRTGKQLKEAVNIMILKDRLIKKHAICWPRR